MREPGGETRSEARMRVDAGTDGRAALRQRQQARPDRLQARDVVLDLRLPAAQLLGERHRHGVHEMRAPGLDDVLERLWP